MFIIKFINKSGFTIDLKYWKTDINGLATLTSITIKSSENIFELNSSEGEYIITSSILDDSSNQNWTELGYQYDCELGNFRSYPSYNGDYYWMYTDQFDITFVKETKTIILIKKDPIKLTNMLFDMITSMSDLIFFIKISKNKYISPEKIRTINDLINDKKLKILNCHQLKELYDLDILTNIESLYFDSEYPNEEYYEFIETFSPMLVNLINIKFSDYFDLPINFVDNLVNLEKIELGYNFNQPLDSLKSLKKLIITKI